MRTLFEELTEIPAPPTCWNPLGLLIIRLLTGLKGRFSSDPLLGRFIRSEGRFEGVRAGEGVEPPRVEAAS